MHFFLAIAGHVQFAKRVTERRCVFQVLGIHVATQMLRLGPLLVVGREGLFAVPVDVPAQASPGDRLIGYLGRCPG